MSFLPPGMTALDVILVFIGCALGCYAIMGRVRTREDRNAQTLLILLFLPITIMTVRYSLGWLLTLNGAWSAPGSTSGSAASMVQAFSGQSLSGLYVESLIAALFVAFAVRIFIGSPPSNATQSSDGHDTRKRGTIMPMNLKETKEDHAQGTRRRRTSEHQTRD